MNKKILSVLGLIGVCVASYSGNGVAGNVAGTKHDLSNPGQSQVCIFCHAPHNAGKTTALWNRRSINSIDMNAFKFYSSDTMNTKPTGSAPSVRSILCLTCHDAVSADGMFAGTRKADAISAVAGKGTLSADWNQTHALVRGSYGGFGGNGCGKCHAGDNFGTTMPTVEFQIGANLTDDHPISIPYPTAIEDPKFKTPPDAQLGWADVKLFDGLVECASCHDPHDQTVGMFLRKSNSQSALCLTCHDK